MRTANAIRISVTLASLAALDLDAAPAGMTVQRGTASLSQHGNQLNITASHNAFLNWQSFNINAGETARFIQPSASSIVWNRINDANPSQIYGGLEANGVVVLMNQSGFYFGPNSFVNAAGLVVSTAPVTPVESSAGLFWQFSGPPPQASIVNYGHLNAGRGGSLFLIGERIENHGTLSAPEGRVALLAGKEVWLSSRPDGLALSASVTLPSGSIENSGQILADAGTIALHARVVNQDGLIQANSIRERNGVIELVASESITLGDHSLLSARADSAGVSKGGEITIKSEGTFADSVSSHISVGGGEEGGDGGFAEVSAPVMSSIRSEIDGRAQAGYRGGKLLIDPQDIIIGDSGSDSAGTGNVGSDDPPAAGTLTLDKDTAFLGFSQITLQATRNITVAANTRWDLVESTGLSEAGSLLKLEAGNNITVSSGASIFAGENWSVTLQAGRDFASPDTVRLGVGNIAFSGTGSLETRNGNISLLAGNNITVGSGFVRTVDGGNITAVSLGGSINTGTRNGGFTFSEEGYAVSPDLGGISTAKGGNVTLNALWDIVGYIPVSGAGQTDAGSGAFGEERGDVTVTAGRYVTGHYVVRNGTGTITAGRDAGFGGVPFGTRPPVGEPNFPAPRLLALSLVNGGWNVNAAGNILLQEVRNPNGIFNNSGSTESPNYHRFDYSPDAYTVLHAGNSVQLRGTALPRNDFDEVPSIYPGRLEITAGAGGVILGNDVTLFPSPLGNLRITTTAGGSLVGAKSGDLAQLIMSDSGKTQYRQSGDFGVSDHASAPIHLNNDTPVILDISGNLGGTLVHGIVVDGKVVDDGTVDEVTGLPNRAQINSGLLIAAPKKAEITVGGNMINGRFDGQNLRASDVTTLHVAGDIINRNEFTTVPAGSTPNFGVFDLVYPPLQGSVAGVQNLFTYNATTGELSFQGRMTGDQLQALQNLRIRTFDRFGTPIIGSNGEPVTERAQFASADALTQLFDRSQDVPQNPDTGYRIGGGGTFDLRARNLDLGATVGIVSQGPRANSALARLFTHGADVNIVLSGDLDMFSTKIASLNGGDISIVADGEVNVGSRTFNVGDVNARGIFTTDPSDVTVIAKGDINVNGSRIAAYDGGNILVRSLEGDVDAGTGGNGAATVEKIVVIGDDPSTRQVLTYAPTIPGSGIVATTFPRSLDPAFPPSLNNVGDITVEMPNGNIIARAGGIVQIPLNGVGEKLGTILLVTGKERVVTPLGIFYVPVLSAKNLVTEESLVEQGIRLLLTDRNGNARLDANGNKIFVTKLEGEDGRTQFSDGTSTETKGLLNTLARRRSQLQFADASGTALTDRHGKANYLSEADNEGPPVFTIGRYIDAPAGIIGSDVEMQASGQINATIFARNNLRIAANQNVNVDALAGGNASVSAGDSISGTIIGGGSVTASGAAVDAALLSQNVSASGDVSSSQVGFAQGAAAASTSQSMASEDQAKAAAVAKSTEEEDDKKQKSRDLPVLARTVGRVTVILPSKN